MKKTVLGIILGLLALALAAALGLGFIHLSELPYRACVGELNIEALSGLSRDEIMANYRSVMRYLSPFYSGEFSLATLKFSESGAFHFYECKRIFAAIYALGALSAAIWALAISRLRRGCVPYGALGVSGCVTLLLPAALGAAVALDFERAFVLFHRLFFNNDMWLFDPGADPVITILPAGFFLRCALLICAVLALSAALQLVFYFKMKKEARA